MRPAWLALLPLVAACQIGTPDDTDDTDLVDTDDTDDTDLVSTVELEVEHYKAVCDGWIRDLCLQTREAGEAEYTYQYEPIAQFEFVWGHRYTLEVEITEIPDPAEDGPSRTIDLVRVVDDTPVAAGTEFLVVVDGAAGDNGWGSDLVITEGGGTLRGELVFTCASAEVCADAAAVEADGDRAELTFAYDAELDAVLQTVSVIVF